MNKYKRIFYSFVSSLFYSGKARARFFKKHHLFGSIGDQVVIMERKLPLYSNLIHIHNNVYLGKVKFVTHDGIHLLLNYKYGKMNYVEKIGCIEVMNNVFIGGGTRILFDTRIGNNVIIGAQSFVNKDIPDNSVYAGIPARYICSFDEYVEKHRKYSEAFRALYGIDKVNGVDEELGGAIYADFLKRREDEHNNI